MCGVGGGGSFHPAGALARLLATSPPSGRAEGVGDPDGASCDALSSSPARPSGEASSSAVRSAADEPPPTQAGAEPTSSAIVAADAPVLPHPNPFSE